MTAIIRCDIRIDRGQKKGAKAMKKIMALLLSLAMFISLSACGKSEQVQAVDDMIAAIGVVSLSSEGKIKEAETAVAALTEKEQKQLDQTAVLQEARNSYNALLVKEVDDAIAAIGGVTLESGDAINAAWAAYDGLASELQPDVGGYNALLQADEAFTAAKVGDIEAAISAIGAVSLSSGDAIENARAVYEKYDPDIQNATGNYDALKTAEESYSKLKIDNAIALISKIEGPELENEEAITAAQSAYKTLSDDEASKVTNRADLENVVAEFEALKAEAERQAAIDEARAIVRVTGVWCSKPDSAGGVELYFNFVNNSDQVIKYINFGVTFYNSVGDIVQCKYEKANINYCYDTGPYAKGEGNSGTYWYWGDYYNWEIASVELVSLNIEYMDESTVYLTRDQVDYVQY